MSAPARSGSGRARPDSAPARPRRTVAIAGGGPVGLALAALLGRRPDDLDVRLYEPRPAPRWDPDAMDLRVYALSRASQNILGHLGAWDAIAAARASPYRRMRVWHGGSPAGAGALTFDSADAGEPDLGHIVEDILCRDRILRALRDTSAKVAFGTGIESVEPGDRAVRITTGDGETVSATVLIAADGSDSPIRGRLNFPVTEFSYGQCAVVTHVATERGHGETAWQRFLPDGPLAFLPLLDGRSSVVWSTGPEHAETLCRADEEDFLAELQAAAGDALGRIRSASRRAGFPLRAIHANRYCLPRVALAGDAAHTVHPLAGQGMNLGLLDAAALAEVILDALARDEDPGDLRVLRRYERRRKGANLKMLLALDGLHRLFRLSARGMPRLRALGLGAVDSAPLLKGLLMDEALGLRGDLPAAARALR